MTKVNIISGFLGAGKTTFIKRLIADVFKGEKLVLIENEFGEIGVDGGFLQDAGIEITEMNSGCICCTLVGDFTKALMETVETYNPDRIIIEPSGVGKLSDVIAAVNNTGDENIAVDSCITVVDCTKAKMYVKNFGEFYEDQILYSNCILLTRTDKANEAKIAQAIEIIREINKDANIITTHLDKLDNAQILDAFKKGTMEEDLLAEAMKAHHEHDHHHEHGEHCSCGHDHHHEHGEHCSCGHDHHHEHGEHCSCGHDHHHEHGEHCSCGHDHHHEHGEHCSCDHDHHHEHGEHCSCGQDHHHEHGESCSCGHDHHHEHGEHCSCGHDHHHEHGEHCSCGHDHHHEHSEHCSCGHDHHADEVFTAWGFETAKNYTEADIRSILTTLDGGEYGDILRAKGMVADGENWIYFDYVPEEHEIRNGAPCYTGKICVIGANLKEDKLAELFNR